MMVDVQITKWRYRRNQRSRIGVGVYHINTQVSVKFWNEKKVNKNMGVTTAHNTNNTYENGDGCVRIWKRR